MSRVFILYHAGEVYGRDSVRWYTAHKQENIDKLLNEYHNIGDSVVYDSTLKLLDFDELVPINPHVADDETIEWLNSECSYGIIRGSNYIHSEMDWGNLKHFLNKISIPMAAPGIGMQAPLGTRPQISQTAARFVHTLAERCSSLGVRGDITAQLLWDVGVRNVRVVGCPSMYRSLRPEWRVDESKLGRICNLPSSQLNVAMTLRREIGPDYVQNVSRYLAVQKQLIREAFSHSKLQLFAQGELFEKFFFWGRSDLYEPLYDEMLETGWAIDREDEIFDIYRKVLFFSSDIPVFTKQLATADLATGFRVHGVLPSLAQGIPGVLINYDNRTQELIDTFGIPSATLAQAQMGHILKTAQEHDYGRIARRYAQTWAAMRDFLDENRIPHRMGANGPEMPEKEVSIIYAPRPGEL
jgi:hypothetical protein